jgi:hydroxyacylglutathione hydrolase
MQLALHPGLKAFGGSNQAPGTNTLVKEGDSFKLGSGIDVKWVYDLTRLCGLLDVC